MRKKLSSGSSAGSSAPLLMVRSAVQARPGAFIKILNILARILSRLAQLVEHRSYEPKVTGSSPVSRIGEHGSGVRLWGVRYHALVLRGLNGNLVRFQAKLGEHGKYINGG